MHQWGYLGPRGAQQNDTTTAAAAVQFSLQANINWIQTYFSTSQNDSAAQHYGNIVHDILKLIRSKADVHAV